MAEYKHGEKRPKADIETPQDTPSTEAAVLQNENVDESKYVSPDITNVKAKAGDPGYYMGEYAKQHLTSNPASDKETDSSKQKN